MTAIVDLYSNEPLDLPEADEVTGNTQTDEATPIKRFSSALRRRKQDRRIRDQFQRLDKMVRTRDCEDNALTIIEGTPNLILRIDRESTHRWADLRRAIRNARRDSYAFFDIDQFIGYAVFYNRSGISNDDLLQPRMVDDVQRRLLSTDEGAKDSLFLQQIPMREEHDTQGAPVMRFFSYSIPKRAKADLVHNRLLILGIANMGRLDKAVAEEGVNVEPADSELVDRGYPYTVDLSWPTGEAERMAIPTTDVYHHVRTALHEFEGLSYVIDHITSIKQLPEVISRDNWLEGLTIGGRADTAAQPSSPSSIFDGLD